MHPGGVAAARDDDDDPRAYRASRTPGATVTTATGTDRRYAAAGDGAGRR